MVDVRALCSLALILGNVPERVSHPDLLDDEDLVLDIDLAFSL